MDKNTINEIKNRIYEAEGLLELLHLRPEKEPELAPLILRRIDEARALFGAGEVEKATLAENPEEPVESENIGEPEEPVNPVEPEEPVNPEPGPEPESPRQAPAFCLNDRYRFRRAIFGGSDAEFNATMDRVATLDGFDEAEDFFYGDMGLDAEDPEVAEFMEIIRNYFAQ